MTKHNHTTVDLILQRDWRKDVIPSIGTEPWVTVYQTSPGHEFGIYCGLVPNDQVAAVTKTYEWDVNIGEGGHEVCKAGSSHAYRRFGTDHGIELLVHLRDYSGVRTKHLELSEEFRHFHNLFFDSANGEFLQVLGDGTEEVVGRLGSGRCELRTREVRQFLAIKRMHLAIYFWNSRKSSLALADLPHDELHEHCKLGLTHYSYGTTDDCGGFGAGVRTYSRIIGKKLIAPLELSRCGIWPYEDEVVCESYIIGTDAEGRPREHNSAPDGLANFFGKNEGAPYYLTPVYFRKEVLTKYFANPKKYTVDDGVLRCASLWGLKIDNNHPTHVVVMLGDLGRELPLSEQRYWRSYNVPPDGSGISEVNFRRNVLGEWTDAQAPDLVLKAAYKQARGSWLARYGWDLFRDLPDGDTHCFVALKQVTVDDHAEFDLQVGRLTKLLVDAINEVELANHLPDKKAEEKGISKLKRFLEAEGLPGIDGHIGFLRDLQDVRSAGAAHLKGSNFEKVSGRLGFREKGLPKVFDELLARGTALVDALRRWCESKSEQRGSRP